MFRHGRIAVESNECRKFYHFVVVEKYAFKNTPRMNMFFHGEFYERIAGCMQGVDDARRMQPAYSLCYDRMHAACIHSVNLALEEQDRIPRSALYLERQLNPWP